MSTASSLPCYDHNYGCFSSILADSEHEEEPSYENDVDADDDDVYEYNATPAATQTMANKHKKIKCNKKLLDESVSLQNIFPVRRKFTQIPSLGIRIIINALNSQSEPEAHHNRLYVFSVMFIPAKINLFQLN